MSHLDLWKLAEPPPGPRSCLRCVHFYRFTDWETGYSELECRKIPGRSNLRSFPFRNTTCRGFKAREGKP